MSGIKILSDRGIALLKREEGLRLTTYIDGAGFPTIGYGHKLLPGESFPNGITEAQAEQLLRDDATKAKKAVNSGVNVPLTQGQFDALVSLTFNIGVGAFNRSTLLRVLNKGDYQSAADWFPKWKYAGGLPILLARREREKALFLS